MRFQKSLPLWVVSLFVGLAGASSASDPVLEENVNEQAHRQARPADVTFGFERLQLPGSESLGLLGASYVIELTPGWWLGPAVYGAATGQRGGLFTWGAEAQRRWRLDNRWTAVVGMYAGGGGGAAAPVGGGLMLRPHADLMFDFGGWAAGITASQVRFPSGTIRSAQLGLLVAFQDDFTFTAPGHAGKAIHFDGNGGLDTDRMHLTAGGYESGPSRSVQLDYIGMRLERQISDVLFATVEAAGAAAGGADGYAEGLGGVLALWPGGDSFARFGVRAAAGLGGGGGVPTRGGPIAKLAFASRLRLSKQFSIDLEAGRARAFNGDFNSRFAQLSMGMKLGEALTSAASGKILHDMEWALSRQNYLRAQRKDGSVRSLSAIGLKFRRSVSKHLYLSGQALGAITGGAGAYSVGLVGLGATTRFGAQARWSIGAEAMVGAAGGGGIASRGGAIAQPMAWVGRDIGRYNRIKVGTGYVKSVRGELSSPVVDVTWAIEFGAP